MAGDKSITPIVQTRFDEFDARLSADGRWFVYTSDESGRAEVYVQAFPPTGTKWTVSAQGGAEPRWRHDGRELLYLAPDRSVMSVAIDAVGTFKAGVPRRLFTTRTPTFGNPYRTNLEVTADGQRFLVNVGPDAGASSPVNVVVNWTTALQRK